MQELTSETFSQRLVRVSCDTNFRQRIKLWHALVFIAALATPFLIGHWAINITFPIWMMWVGISEAVLSHCSGMAVRWKQNGGSSLRHRTYSGTFAFRYQLSTYYVAIVLGVFCLVNALVTGSAALFQGH